MSSASREGEPGFAPGARRTWEGLPRKPSPRPVLDQPATATPDRIKSPSTLRVAPREVVRKAAHLADPALAKSLRGFRRQSGGGSVRAGGHRGDASVRRWGTSSLRIGDSDLVRRQRRTSADRRADSAARHHVAVERSRGASTTSARALMGKLTFASPFERPRRCFSGRRDGAAARPEAAAPSSPGGRSHPESSRRVRRRAPHRRRHSSWGVRVPRRGLRAFLDAHHEVSHPSTGTPPTSGTRTT
jgi:hypothetical protein